MALPLGKLTILIGAGLVGSVLAKEGSLPTVTDFFSGAFKIASALKKIPKGDDSSSSSGKPRSDSLLAQVNNLREELQLLASNRSVTIISGSRAGASIGAPVIIVILVGGYGIIWWKGWKLSNMMFATRRSLSDACTSVGSQLEQVFSSIKKTEQNISLKITEVDSSVEECKGLTEATREEVSMLKGDVGSFSEGVQNVHNVVKTLETRFSRIEGKQNLTTEGVLRLCGFVNSLENSKTATSIQASPSTSKPALEQPQTTPAPRVLMQTRSLHRGLSLDPCSPSIQASLSDASSAATELPQIMHSSRTTSMPPRVPSPEPVSPSILHSSRTTSMPPRVPSPEPVSPSISNGSSSAKSGRFGWFFGNGSSTR